MTGVLPLEEIWPPYRLSVVEGDLALTVVRDEDLPGLVALALAGVHDPAFMPFSHAWTDTPAADLPAEFARYHWSSRARFAPAAFTLNFAVRVDGELVGIQALSTENYAITRTGETGSWLAAQFQGRGIGTRMRLAICALAFDHLSAAQVTSGAFADNLASLGVSRKVGYQPNGTKLLARRGHPALNQQLLLTPGTFIRGHPIAVIGAAELRAFLGLAH